MEEMRSFLAADVVSLFKTGAITRSRYSRSIRFEDPISASDSLDAFVLNLTFLRTAFNIDFRLHSCEITGEEEVTARWTMKMTPWPLPWRPELTFTGRSVYSADLATGLVISHVDYWDHLDHNRFLSLEAVTAIVRNLVKPPSPPTLGGGIEAHKYLVLKKVKDYETRLYPSYLVVEAEQPVGSGPASGSGFSDLARYLNPEGNRQGTRLEMTTPILSLLAPADREGHAQSIALQFVMEGRFKTIEQLPSPSSDKIHTRQEPGGYFAAIQFNGWPLDGEVVEKERELRRSLARDGLKGKPGCMLARYSEPTVPPLLRKNEVLIELEGYQWPPDTTPLQQVRWRRTIPL